MAWRSTELGYLHGVYSNDPKLSDQQSWARKHARTGFFTRLMVLPASCSQAQSGSELGKNGKEFLEKL